MINSEINERRRSMRAYRILNVRHRLHKRSVPPNKSWNLTVTENMSAYGILFTSPIPYSIDDIIEMEVVMSGVLDVFKGYARVVWAAKRKKSNAYSIGVEYVGLRPKKNNPKKSTTKVKAKSKAKTPLRKKSKKRNK